MATNNNPKRPLKDGESLERTIGCRHSNPDICSKNSLPDVCAFVRDDGVCLAPPRSWKKLFEELSKRQ